MRTQRAFSSIALLCAAGCSSPQPSNPPLPPTAASIASSATAAAAPPTATATAQAAAEAPCPGRRPIGNASFAPDMQSVLTACAGYHICDDESGGNAMLDVWSVPQGKIARSLPTGMDNVRRIQWGPGGWVVTVADPTTGGGAMHLFSAATWEQKFETSFYCIADIAFNPAGSTVAMSGCDGRIIAIDTATAKVVHRPEKEAHIGGDYSVGVEFSEDGKTLFVDDENDGLQELDPRTLRRRSTRTARDGGRCAGWSPKGEQYAAVTGQDSTLVVAGPRGPTRTLVKELGSACMRLVWVDAKRFALALYDGSVSIWDPAGKGSRRDLSVPDDPLPVDDFQVDPAGSILIGGDESGALLRWDIATGARSLLWQPPPPKDPGVRQPPAPTVTWSAAGDRFAAVAGDRAIVWETKSGREVAQMPVNADGPGRIVWSPGGDFLAVADGTLLLLRFSDGERLTLSMVDHQGARTGIAGSPSGAFAGPPDLARCVVPAAVPAERRAQRQALLADFLAGKPVKGGP